MSKNVQTLDIDRIEDYFDSEKLAESMVKFLSKLDDVRTDYDRGYIDTKIGDNDGKGYVYIGVDDTHTMIGGKPTRGSFLISESKLASMGRIVTHNIFTDEAREAVETLKDGYYHKYYELLEDIESYKKLIFPINFSAPELNKDTNKHESNGVYLNSHNGDKSLIITKINAKYDPELNRCPLKYYLSQSLIDNTYTKVDLTDYFKSWYLTRVVQLKQSTDMVEFSSANYIKTIVLKDRVKGSRLVIDCTGVYFIKNNNVVFLGPLTEEDLMGYVDDFNIPKKFLKYLSKENIKIINNHSRFIVPYRCGDMKIIEV